MRRVYRRITTILLISLFFCCSASSQEVIVNKPQSENDRRYDYPHKLLQLILDATVENNTKANVTHSEFAMTRDRMLFSLISGDKLHVVAEAPKKEWLEKLLVIRIPIRKGIQGYRLFFINQDDQALISKMNSLSEFVTLPTGSGVGWSTAEIMRKSGFKVVFGSNYDSLFDMLERRRFVTFGRGINEIYPEFNVKKPRYPNLAIEETLVVHIPLPTYFFVSPKKPQLAKRIERGLMKLIESGDFDAYFMSYHQEVIEKTNLTKRKVFSLPNPNLSEADPLNIEKFWYTF